MTPEASADSARAPTATEFAVQLIRQLHGDLDGILFDRGAAEDEALPAVAQAAANALPRGGALMLLIRAAIEAHREMLPELAALSEREDDEIEALRELVPAAVAQHAALLGHATQLEHYLGLAESRPEPVTRRLARVITRFYTALGEDDETGGHRSLLELRSMHVHLDAAALALETATSAPEPLRVLRPDRFHDHFMRYASLAQNPEGAAREQPLATLTRDGKLSAVITADQHPLEAAAQAVREQIDGDEILRNHTLARIRALLEFIDGLRRQPMPVLGDPASDATVHLSLVLAAATAPLHASQNFTPDALAQIARYNQTLLRQDLPRGNARH